MMLSLQEILDKLRVGDESAEIEAKSVKAINDDVLRTVSAMSNEPNRHGGYIVFGIAQDQSGLFGTTFEVVGVDNPGKLQENLATRCCNDLSPEVRPTIEIEGHDGKAVIVAYIPEASNKPVFIKSEGLPRGAYRRIGSTDHHCTDDDLAVLYQSRQSKSFDSNAVEGSSPGDIDPNAIAEYRRQRALVRPDAPELAFSDTDLLYALGATSTNDSLASLTIAGMMLFGREVSLRRYSPMARVDYIRVEGREWVRDPEKRYSGVEFRGPLVLLIPRIVSQVLSDIPASFTLSAGEIHRRDVPLVPRTVIREAVVNALMHRTYRVASPVQIIRYSNRIEIRNPGASLVAEDRLGEPGSVTRNEKIAAALHDVGLAETKGTGIRAMKTAMHDANLTPPLFESDRMKDEFGVMLLVHHLLGPEDQAWLASFKDLTLSDDEARALVVIREAGVINNAMYRDINRGVDTLTASKTLRRLCDSGLLEKKGKGNATYYVPTPAIEKPPSKGGKSIWTEPNLAHKTLSDDGNPIDNALPDRFAPSDRGTQKVPAAGMELPPELAEAVQAIGQRSDPSEIEAVIIRLCQLRPMSAAELAKILRRSKPYLLGHYLGSMLQKGQLEHTFPDEPAHPRQAYKPASPGEAKGK